jgi:formimidoylglutamate deiminase
MYAVALRITPDELRAVAAQLYVELLAGGYTQVCEFHYLQHDGDGQPYDDPLELSWTLADAAAEAGIGLTLLPVLYERAGFAQPRLRATSGASPWARRTPGARRSHQRQRWAGRCSTPGWRSTRCAPRRRNRSPRCVAWPTASPARSTSTLPSRPPRSTTACGPPARGRSSGWRSRACSIGAGNWCMPPTPCRRRSTPSAASGAGVVICPTTEANLGDGLADLPGWLAAGVPLAIGSDSHVSRDALEELRWLDYGQRLGLRRRNVAAAPQAGIPSTAERLFGLAVSAGAAAAGRPAWGLRPGARADALVADLQDAPLLGVPSERLLDALVFSSPGRPWRDVMVAGRWGSGADPGPAFGAAMSALV